MRPISPAALFVWTPQTAFSESRSSPKTPEAPNSSVTKPTVVAAKLAAGLGRLFEHAEERLSALRPDDGLDLVRDLTAGHFSPKDHAGDADADHQQRRDREERVKGQSSAQPRRVDCVPTDGGLFD